MKEYTNVSFGTALLITAAIILFGFFGCPPNNESKDNLPVQTLNCSHH